MAQDCGQRKEKTYYVSRTEMISIARGVSWRGEKKIDQLSLGRHFLPSKVRYVSVRRLTSPGRGHHGIGEADRLRRPSRVARHCLLAARMHHHPAPAPTFAHAHLELPCLPDPRPTPWQRSHMNQSRAAASRACTQPRSGSRGTFELINVEMRNALGRHDAPSQSPATEGQAVSAMGTPVVCKRRDVQEEGCAPVHREDDDLELGAMRVQGVG